MDRRDLAVETVLPKVPPTFDRRVLGDAATNSASSLTGASPLPGCCREVCRETWGRPLSLLMLDLPGPVWLPWLYLDAAPVLCGHVALEACRVSGLICCPATGPVCAAERGPLAVRPRQSPSVPRRGCARLRTGPFFEGGRVSASKT